jgi:hypothetical protein
MRKVILFLSVLLLHLIYAQAQIIEEEPQNIPISASYSEKNLLEIFQDLEQRYPLQFFYREEWIPRARVNFTVSGMLLRPALNKLLDDTSLDFVFYGETGVVIARSTDMEKLDAFSFDEYVAVVNALDEKKKKVSYDLFVIGDSTIRPLPDEATVSGTIFNIESDEGLPGARIALPDLNTGAFGDSTGNFTLTIPTGEHKATVEAPGHEKITTLIRVYSDGTFDVPLAFTAYQLEEVLLQAETAGQNLNNAQAGKIQISMIDLRNSPSLLGEVDIVNAILLLPGVTNAGEASSGFNVRGGNIDQNLIMQDGNMIFNSSHLLGFFSVLNPDIVQNVTLYKGHIPAQFGGRVSSVLDVDIIDGSYRNFKGRGTVGLFSSKFALNGPIQKGKSSFVVGMRAAYPTLITQFSDNRDVKQSSAYYGDVSVKVSQKIGELGKLSAFGYASTDFFRFSQDFGFDWSNLQGGLTYQQIFDNDKSLKIRVNSGRYTSNFFNAEGVEGSENISGIDNLNAKINFQMVQGDNHNLNMGVEGTYYDVHPNETRPFGENSAILPRIAQKDQGLELAAYINDDFRLNPYISFSVGLRGSFFQNMGPFQVLTYAEGEERTLRTVQDSIRYEQGESITDFLNLEPRISARILFNEETSMKVSYNRVNQYLHLLSNTASSTPIDLWQVSNPYFPAQRADNFSIGLFKNWRGKEWQSSLEFFYRDLKGLVVTKDFARLLTNPNIETEVLNAKGIAYGAEFSLKRDIGKFSIEGSFAYTRSLRQTVNNPGGQNVNGGRWFPADFDSPINISITAKYRPLTTRTISASFIYRSGRPITSPAGAFAVYPSWFIPLFSDRNQYRIPDYHRLDLAYTFDDGIINRKKFKTDLTFSVYNIYARRNAFSVFFRREGNSFRAFKLAILGTALPFVSYNFRF